MGLLQWVGDKWTRLTSGRHWGLYGGGGDNWAGRSVNEENSLLLSPWWRAVKLYADVVGALPLKQYERVGDNKVQVHSHKVADLIGLNPNIDQTGQEFWGSKAAELAMFGNSYSEKRFVGKTLAALELLPCETLPDRTRQGYEGELWYRFNDRGQTEWLHRDKVLHVRGWMLGKSDVGMSPLANARQGLSLSLATEEATGKTFSQGLRTGGFFFGPTIKPDQRDQIEKTYIEPMRGNDAKNFYGILPPGFDFKPISIHPKDAEMLMSRRFNVEELCRWMGVPPILVGHQVEGQTGWGTGIEAIINQWFTSGLNSFLTNIESAINKRLFTAVEQSRFFVEYERKALLRTDSAARGELYWKLVQVGAMTPNQICDKENFPRFDGGDVRLVNSTLTKLETLGQQPPARVQPAPGEPIPEPTP